MTYRIALILATSDEATEQIVDQLVRLLRALDHRPEVITVEGLDGELHLDEYDGAVVAAAPVDDDFPMDLNRLVRRLRADLHELPSAFLTALPTSFEEDIEELVTGFTDRTQWQPVVLGALSPTQASTGFVKKLKVEVTGRHRLMNIDYEQDYKTTQKASLPEFIAQLEVHLEAHRRLHDGEFHPGRP